MKCIKLLVSIIIVYIIFLSVELEELKDIFKNVELIYFFCSLAIFFVGQFVSALRLVYILDIFGRKISLFFSVEIHFIGLLFNQVLPTSLGGDIIRALKLKEIVGWSKSARSILLDRISGFLVILLQISVFLPMYYFRYDNYSIFLLCLFFIICSFSSLLVLSFINKKRTIIMRIPRPGKFIVLIFRDILRFKAFSPFCHQLWTSLFVHFSGIFSYALLGKSIGLEIGVLNYFLLVPLVFLIALLPISFAGWGVREVGAIGLFGLVGVENEYALAMSVLFGVVLILASIPGAFFWVKQNNCQVVVNTKARSAGKYIS